MKLQTINDKTNPLTLASSGAPPGMVTSIHVEILRTEVHHEKLGWFTLQSKRKNYNLLRLVNNVNEVLGDQTMAPGKYTQIRLILGENNWVDVDNAGQITKYPLKVPSGGNTGIKLNKNFIVEDHKHIQVYLDFNISSLDYVKGQSGYVLKPTIKINSFREFDAVEEIGPEGGTIVSINETSAWRSQ